MQKYAKPGGSVDAVILNLNEKSAIQVEKIAKGLFYNTLGGSGGFKGYFPVKALPTAILMSISAWLPAILDSENNTFPNEGKGIETFLFFFAVVLNFFSLNYSAWATTFCVFGPCCYGLSLMAKDFVGILEESFEIGWEGEEEEGDEESLMQHAGKENGGSVRPTPAEYSKRLKNTIEKFNMLKATTRHFSTGFGFLFFMAEFILIPTAVLVGFILYLKASEDMDVGDKCILAFSCFMLVIILVIVLGLFMSGVNLTTQLEEVTHKISELKSHEILLRGSGNGEWDAYLKQWERWERTVVATDLGFTPFKIRIESRLALTVFYVVVRFAVTVNIELAL